MEIIGARNYKMMALNFGHSRRYSRNGGRNLTPKRWDPETGLARNIKQEEIL